ncbi:hypothetical protein GCM10007932_48840 [Vibrio penaeicida]|uniref:Uncharacterized protein n=1 Tax=Vibrio penaeicida TaxID=104609 RepID=A0AAV5NYS7_9VIBR|nr:hypothetical protein GCM10007932_48840 [Vibrio penaeicida]
MAKLSDLQCTFMRKHSDAPRSFLATHHSQTIYIKNRPLILPDQIFHITYIDLYLNKEYRTAYTAISR